jgi:hypothetical protein
MVLSDPVPLHAARPARLVSALVALLVWLIGLGPFLHAHAGPAAITGWHLPAASTAAAPSAFAGTGPQAHDAARRPGAGAPESPAVAPGRAITDTRLLAAPASHSDGTFTPDGAAPRRHPLDRPACAHLPVAAAAAHSYPHAVSAADLLPALPNAPPLAV